METRDILSEVEEIARDALIKIRSFMESKEIKVDIKKDGTPVSNVDFFSQEIIMEGLWRRFNDVVVSEEMGEDDTDILSSMCGLDNYWLLDPIDGTKELLRGSKEFTINIAKVVKGEVQLGVIGCPLLGTTYSGITNDKSYRIREGEREEIHIRVRDIGEGIELVHSHGASRSKARRILVEDVKVSQESSVGSALKMCLIASGEADLCYRLSRSWEWDVAAGHAIISGAGGHVVKMEDVSHRYSYNNNHALGSGFIAYGDHKIAQMIKSYTKQ